MQRFVRNIMIRILSAKRITDTWKLHVLARAHKYLPIIGRGIGMHTALAIKIPCTLTHCIARQPQKNGLPLVFSPLVSIGSHHTGYLLDQHAITNINTNLTAVMKGNSSAKEMHNAHMVLDECERERKSLCFCPIDRKNRVLSEHFRAKSYHILFGRKPTSPRLFSSFSSLSPPQARIKKIKHSFD